MKNILILMAALMLVPSVSIAQSRNKKGGKEVSPIIEGKQKVRKTDYDSVWKFTSFDAKKIYYCRFDYTQIESIVASRNPDWGTFNPVMNYLLTVGRSPMRVCAVFAVNPTIEDPARRESIIKTAQEEALASLNALTEWMQKKEMKNKVQVNVAQLDYRYFQGTDYFITEQPSDALIHVGLVIFLGTKKIDLFPNAAAGAQKFKDVKFFPNDATVRPSYDVLMDSVAAYLLSNENFEVLLRGYTDNVGTAEYCRGLARQRAVEIKKKLIARGVAEYRIEVESKGSEDPIGDNSTYEGRIANNRASIIIQ